MQYCYVTYVATLPMPPLHVSSRVLLYPVSFLCLSIRLSVNSKQPKNLDSSYKMDLDS